MIENNTDFADYILIDWNKPPPVIQPKPVRLTSVERISSNRAFAMNQTTKRYIEKGKYNEYLELFERNIPPTTGVSTSDRD